MQVPGKGLVYTQHIYDTVHLPISAAGALVAQFFAVPFGGLLLAGVNKNLRHTNLYQAGRLEAGNSMQIAAMTMFFPKTAQSGALPTIGDFRAIRAGNIRLVMGGDTQFHVTPASELPCAAAGEVLTVDAAAAPYEWAQNGAVVVQNKYYFDEPITLSEQETISVFLENMDAIIAPTQVRISLWGPALRPVR